MPTGQALINNVLTAIGRMPPGYTPNVPDSTDSLAELNVLLDAWSAENALVFSCGVAQYPLVAAQATYLIGSGAADFNVPRPSRIDAATIVATVGSGKSRTPLRIVKKEEYFAHGDLAAAASSPEELYPDYAMPYCGLNLFPVPNCPTATKLELETWTQLTQMDLVTNVLFPPGYQDAIQQALGFRLLSHFGIRDELIVAKTQRLAAGAEDRIRALNVQNRMLDPALLPQARPPQGQQPQQLAGPQG